MEQLKIKHQSEIRQQPLKDPVLVRVMIERETVEKLKRLGFENDTTMSELIRGMIAYFLNYV